MATTKFTVTINAGRATAEISPNMTLFAALRRSGILLPTGCGARGKCGQCRIRVEETAASPVSEAEAAVLPKEEIEQGYRLACQCRTDADLRIAIPDFVFNARERRATLAAVTPLTHDIKRFSFALDAGELIPHRAGQFLTLSAAVPDTPGRTVRCFSFSTEGSVLDRVDIIVRRNPRGVMTPFLFEQAPGLKVTIAAPYGEFVLREGARPMVWIAGGSGLSPFVGMAGELIESGETRPTHLFFGAVLPADLYYVDFFNEIARAHPWFAFTPALSGPERCEACREYGLITEVVEKYLQNAENAEAYLCGGPGMIHACIDTLERKGLPRERIYFDRF